MALLLKIFKNYNEQVIHVRKSIEHHKYYITQITSCFKEAQLPFQLHTAIKTYPNLLFFFQKQTEIVINFRTENCNFSY